MRLVCGFVCLGAVAAIWWSVQLPAPAVQAADLETARERGPKPKPRLEGVGSCSAAACHGGELSQTVKGSEYSIWMDRDPHHNAYTVLFDKRSDRIQKNLHGSDAKPAAKNTLCLRCHAMTAGPEAGEGRPVALADGVGCESCHGRAEKWLTRHYLKGWKEQSDEAKKLLGFEPTKNLLARARQCVECHVGGEDADVNHDLIAAGHPRLRFEYGAYLANLPKHWDEHAEKARRPDLEARVWALGQVVSAQQALNLLAHRAEEKTAKPWPEFAEYRCFACHHDLRDEGWRKQVKEKRRAGALEWGTWYFSDMLPRALGTRAAKEDTNAVSDALKKLRSAMQEPFPDTKKVKDLAHAAANLMEPWAEKLSQTKGAGAAEVHKLFMAIQTDAKPAGKGWDQAAQRYLAIAALYHGMGDLDSRHSKLELKAFILEMKRNLRFPDGFASPHNLQPREKASHP